MIVWSLGNETGYGPNHDAAAGWIRSHDPTRPVQYDRPWTSAGTEVAREQVVLAQHLPPLGAPALGAVPPGAVPLDAQDRLTDELLRSGPGLCLWRALTDNDNAFSVAPRFLRSGFFRLDVTDENVEHSDGSGDGSAHLHRRLRPTGSPPSDDHPPR